MKPNHKRLLSLTISAALCGLIGAPATALAADSEESLTTTIDSVSTGNTPSGIAINSATDTLFVTNADDNNVSIIDGINNSVIDTVGVGEMPLGIALNSGKTLAYTVNFSSGNVSVIDTATNTVVDTIETGGSPTQVAVTPDDSQVFVTDAQHDGIHIIDTATGQTRDITINVPAEGIAISPDGQ